MVDIPGITEEELAEAKKAVYFNPIAPAYMLKKELGFTGSYLDKEKYNTYKRLARDICMKEAGIALSEDDRHRLYIHMHHQSGLDLYYTKWFIEVHLNYLATMSNSSASSSRARSHPRGNNKPAETHSSDTQPVRSQEGNDKPADTPSAHAQPAQSQEDKDKSADTQSKGGTDKPADPQSSDAQLAESQVEEQKEHLGYWKTVMGGLDHIQRN